VNPAKVSEIKQIVNSFFLQLHVMSCLHGGNIEKLWTNIFGNQAAVREHNKKLVTFICNSILFNK